MSEPAFLTPVRTSYDTVAQAYVERVPPPAGMDAVSRAMFAAFAETVRESGLGPVADIGCGPGRITAHLAEAGVAAFGIDLSPRMVELARHVFPHLQFTQGSVTALELGDATIGGVLAWFSTHHLPPEQLPVAYAEIHRVLRPGGHLLLGGHVGDDHQTFPSTAYGGLPVSYSSYLVPTERIVGLLGAAGFEVIARLDWAREPGATRGQACVLARRA